MLRYYVAKHMVNIRNLSLRHDDTKPCQYIGIGFRYKIVFGAKA